MLRGVYSYPFKDSLLLNLKTLCSDSPIGTYSQIYMLYSYIYPWISCNFLGFMGQMAELFLLQTLLIWFLLQACIFVSCYLSSCYVPDVNILYTQNQQSIDRCPHPCFVVKTEK